MATTLCSDPEQKRVFTAIDHLLEHADEVAICAHTNPDGDAIGSVLALKLALAAWKPTLHVTCLLADSDPVPRIYRFLPASDTFVHVSNYTLAPDLFVCLDLSSTSRLNEAQKVFARAKQICVLDHHPTDEDLGEAALIRPDAAAAGVIVAEYIHHMGIHITSDIAQCLLCAIITDTGRFQYQNTDGEALKVASLLVDAGANPSEVSLHVYQSYRLEYLHLESLVMSRIQTYAEGRISYSYATYADMQSCNVAPDECDGLVDIVRSVDGTQIALLLKEVPGGGTRGNLRSKFGHDISGVAQALGGGGHAAAAGFTCPDSIEETFNRALPLLQDVLNGQRGVSE